MQKEDQQRRTISVSLEGLHRVSNKLLSIKPVISVRTRRWVTRVVIHLSFGALILGSVLNDYLLFDEIMASTFIVFSAMFFAEEETRENPD